jgi:hypothetical protein
LIQEDETHRGLAADSQSVRFESPVALNEARDFYLRQQREKDGVNAVAGARSFQTLKSADAPSDTLLAGAEALRAAPSTGLPAQRVGSRGTVPAAGVADPAANAAVAAQELALQSHFVGGKAFYQNGANWIDSEVQKSQNAPKVRVQFGSNEYFALLKKNPSVAKWAAQGKSVQFVLANTLYEIYE